MTGPPAYEVFQSSSFHCGDPVNETMYDNLLGIAKRKTHPLFEEPEVSMIFKKNELDQLDLKNIEENLQSSLEEVCDYTLKRPNTSWKTCPIWNIYVYYKQF